MASMYNEKCIHKKDANPTDIENLIENITSKIYVCTQPNPLNLPLANDIQFKDLLIKALQLIQIDLKFQQFFGLRKFSTKEWLKLDEKLHEVDHYEFELRLRLAIRDTIEENPRLLNFQFCQAKQEFLNLQSTTICFNERSTILALCPIDMYRSVLEHEFERSGIEKNYKKFVPRKIRKNCIPYFLKKALNKQLKNMRTDLKVESLKKRYLEMFEKICPNYLIEYFDIKDGVKLRINAYRETIRISSKNKNSDEWETVCAALDAQYSVINDNTIVMHVNSNPIEFEFLQKQMAQSFHILLHNYRLLVKLDEEKCRFLPLPKPYKMPNINQQNGNNNTHNNYSSCSTITKCDSDVTYESSEDFTCTDKSSPTRSSKISNEFNQTNTELDWENFQCLFQINSELKAVELIGEGTYGKVYKGIIRKQSKPLELVAIKTMKEFSSKDDFKREFEIMAEMSHPNVIAVKERIYSDKLYLIMEYLENGSLETYLKKYQSQLDIHTRLRFCLEIAKGMDYICGKNIVHRDLAARNILISQDGNLKISDFGLARRMNNRNCYQTRSNRRVPITSYAPECRKDDQIFTECSDVWSYGIVMYDIFSIIPSSSNKSEEIPYSCPLKCPAELYENLMRNCWADDPQKRPLFQQIILFLEYF